MMPLMCYLCSPNGNIYVAGGTESDAPSFPGNEAGTIGPDSMEALTALLLLSVVMVRQYYRSTFIGTTGIDQVFGIQFDSKGFPYITGQTTGQWPVVNNATGRST